MARTARAAVYEKPNAPFVIREYPLVDPGPGEVLVRITMSTICRSDIHSYEGKRPNPCPGILGHEIIGTVEQIGAKVGSDMRGSTLAPGDRVTWTEYFFEGECWHRDVLDMPQKCPGIRKYGHDLAADPPHFLGGFAEYCYIQPGTGILKLPDALSDEEATPLNCGVATMISVTEAAAIGMGDAVVVQGLGLLGLYGCAMAKARGARLVIGLDAVPARMETARRFGADEVLNVESGEPKDLIEQVRKLCPPDGADVVVEVCGVPEVIPAGLEMLRTGGRYVLGGVVNPDANVTIDANVLLRKWIMLKGIHNYHPRHLIQALDFVMGNRHRFPFGEIVDSKFALDDLGEAFRRASERSVLRAAIVP
ncbi:MAG TPA: zinc-binding dehydrogenase [Gammaproteobacteria bacterium]|nr:zinc-binding dehydrogenase [Gammaproteobacteria bacterium]